MVSNLNAHTAVQRGIPSLSANWQIAWILHSINTFCSPQPNLLVSNTQYMLIRKLPTTGNVTERRSLSLSQRRAVIDDEPAEHIRQVLEERYFDLDGAAAGEENPYETEAHYEERDVDDYELQYDWKLLQQSLKTKTRLFNQEAEVILESIFEGLAEHKTFKDDSVIVDAGPERLISKLYRARVFQSDEKLAKALENPDREMGPPPFSTAAAGRMNAQGISVFYGSTAPEVALAEIRPPVGSRVVVVCFNSHSSVTLVKCRGTKRDLC